MAANASGSTPDGVVVFSTSMATTMKLKSDIARLQRILDAKHIRHEVVDLSTAPERRKAMLVASGGVPRLPQLHVNGTFLGDTDHIQELEDWGELDAALGCTARPTVGPAGGSPGPRIEASQPSLGRGNTGSASAMPFGAVSTMRHDGSGYAPAPAQSSPMANVEPATATPAPAATAVISQQSVDPPAREAPPAPSAATPTDPPEAETTPEPPKTLLQLEIERKKEEIERKRAARLQAEAAAPPPGSPRAPSLRGALSGALSDVLAEGECYGSAPTTPTALGLSIATGRPGSEGAAPPESTPWVENPTFDVKEPLHTPERRVAQLADMEEGAGFTSGNPRVQRVLELGDALNAMPMAECAAVETCAIPVGLMLRRLTEEDGAELQPHTAGEESATACAVPVGAILRRLTEEYVSGEERMALEEVGASGCAIPVGAMLRRLSDEDGSGLQPHPAGGGGAAACAIPVGAMLWRLTEEHDSTPDNHVGGALAKAVAGRASQPAESSTCAIPVGAMLRRLSDDDGPADGAAVRDMLALLACDGNGAEGEAEATSPAATAPEDCEAVSPPHAAGTAIASPPQHADIMSRECPGPSPEGGTSIADDAVGPQQAEGSAVSPPRAELRGAHAGQSPAEESPRDAAPEGPAAIGGECSVSDPQPDPLQQPAGEGEGVAPTSPSIEGLASAGAEDAASGGGGDGSGDPFPEEELDTAALLRELDEALLGFEGVEGVEEAGWGDVSDGAEDLQAGWVDCGGLGREVPGVRESSDTGEVGGRSVVVDAPPASADESGASGAADPVSGGVAAVPAPGAAPPNGLNLGSHRIDLEALYLSDDSDAAFSDAVAELLEAPDVDSLDGRMGTAADEGVPSGEVSPADEAVGAVTSGGKRRASADGATLSDMLLGLMDENDVAAGAGGPREATEGTPEYLRHGSEGEGHSEAADTPSVAAEQASGGSGAKKPPDTAVLLANLLHQSSISSDAGAFKPTATDELPTYLTHGDGG